MFTIGEQLQRRYEVNDILAMGGEGQVARAIDNQSGAMVAIKKLDAQSDSKAFEERLKRFQRAGQLRINHPAVVDPIECFDESGAYYIVMPLIEGFRLDELVQATKGTRQIDVALHIISALADAVAAIHAQGVIHRDLKPENILITHDGSVRIVDFGICRLSKAPAITISGGVLGTPAWMSPEQVSNPGAVDHRTDLHAIGAIFYYLLTGIPPFDRSDPQKSMDAVRNDLPRPPRAINSAVPDVVDRACMRLLDKDPSRRFNSATEFLAVINGNGLSQAQSACSACHTPLDGQPRFCHRCGVEQMSTPPEPCCLACGGASGAGITCQTCNRQFSSHDHQIAFVAGVLAGRVLRIPEGWHEVGRAFLGPRDHQISQRHLRTVCLDGMVFIQDLGSTNKTYVGSMHARAPMQLTPGMKIRIANNVAVYFSH